MTKAITEKRIEALEKAAAPAARQEIPDGLLPGLYLVRQTSKAMSWAVRYRHCGQPRKLTIGSYPSIGLKDARALGGKALRAAAEGRDPAREKKDAKVEAQRQAAEEKRAEADLFENVAAQFLRLHAVKKTRDVSWRETARIIGLQLNDEGVWQEPDDADERKRKSVVARWRGRKVQEIAKRDVISLLNEIAEDAPIMANRTLAAIRKLFTWCIGQDIIAISPCAGVERPANENARSRVLTDDELRLVYIAADREGWPFGPIVKLMLLTGQREREVAGMRRTEIDLDRKMWTLPENRTKNGEPHTVPLSDAVVAIIKALPEIKSKDGFVFAGRHGRPPDAFSQAKTKLDETINSANDGKPISPWVFHDLRRTMVSGMARLGIALPVTEKVINHRSGTFKGVVAVYQHHDFAVEKRAALDTWAAHVEAVVSGRAPADNVIQLRA
jgi:integrase